MIPKTIIILFFSFQLDKWYSATKTPACVIYLRGGTVLCEGKVYCRFLISLHVNHILVNLVLGIVKSRQSTNFKIFVAYLNKGLVVDNLK